VAYTKNKRYRGKIVSGVDYGLSGNPLTIPFDIQGDNSFTDSVAASYNIRGDGTGLRLAYRFAAKHARLTEVAYAYQNPEPKQLNTSLTWMLGDIRGEDSCPYSGVVLTPEIIKYYISQLQSLMFPQVEWGGNPPLARLVVAKLYNMVVFVTRVTVTWKNLWKRDEGFPMGASVELGSMMYEYPTTERVRAGAGFNSSGSVAHSGNLATDVLSYLGDIAPF